MNDFTDVAAPVEEVTTRKLATVRRIAALNPIEGADKIEVATVDGWKVVTQKGIYNVNDLAVYLEIDSWVPHKLAPFLSKGTHPRVYKTIEGERLKTIRLRGQISQGLLLPCTFVTDDYSSNYVFQEGGHNFVVREGDDLTETLGILKWERPLDPRLAGLARGGFPLYIRKTDQERVQNLGKEYAKWVEEGVFWQVTEKLDGSSMTVYHREGEFGVCSRNLNLKETEGNTFWTVARKLELEEKLKTVGLNIAIQGELIGPGVPNGSKNPYGLEEHRFYVFDIWDIDDQRYWKPLIVKNMAGVLGLDHVPVINNLVALDDFGDPLEKADGYSMLNQPVIREGLVFKQNFAGRKSFKAISNKFLLKEKE